MRGAAGMRPYRYGPGLSVPWPTPDSAMQSGVPVRMRSPVWPSPGDPRDHKTPRGGAGARGFARARHANSQAAITRTHPPKE